MHMDTFRDKVAIVTGGASGIGRALCGELARRGARVVVADLNAAGAAEVAAESTRTGGTATAQPVDVTRGEAVEALLADVSAAHGRVDYLFNNAGIAVLGEERDVTLGDWERVLAVNLWGVIHGVRAAYPRMLRQGFGHIVNTASLAGLTPAPMEISYVASKYAVVGLSCALRVEAADLGVRVSVVCPGMIDTPIAQTSVLRGGVDRQAVLDLAAATRPLSPDKCAKVILRGVEKNKAIIIVTPLAYVLSLLTRISPTAAMWWWRRVFLSRVRSLRRPDA
jgi:NAD(P)-dependent dehydrogenase (short-subunit alcohol dehydrogenase family)